MRDEHVADLAAGIRNELTTPGGKPASQEIDEHRAITGESLEGLSTTVLPVTIAALVMPTMIANARNSTAE